MRIQRPTFQHPRVLLEKRHRAFTPMDLVPKAPFYEVLDHLRLLPDKNAGAGWTALTVLNGKLHRVRAGGPQGGPRSHGLRRATIAPGKLGPAGVYAIDKRGNAVELLVKLGAPWPASLESIDAIAIGCLAEDLPGWDRYGWGEDEDLHERSGPMRPDPMDPMDQSVEAGEPC